MPRKFSILDVMSEMSREGVPAETETIEKVSIFDIQPNEGNFYILSNMEQLKNSIFAMGGVQQNILLARLPMGGKYRYRTLAGHRRVRACLELVQEGHREFEHVPAVIRENIDKDAEEALLVMTNSTQRELTEWEKVMQHMHLKEIIPKLKKRQGLDGKTRELEADYLGVSEGQISIYNTIGTKLDTWLMDVFKDGGIGISLAYEAAKLEPEEQKQLVQISVEKGGFTEEDIKQLTGSRTIKGQMKIIEERAVVEDGGSQAEPTPDLEAAEKVTDSVTPEKCPEIGENEQDWKRTAENNPEIDKSGKILAEKDRTEKKKSGFRGGYEPILIDDLINQYSSYLEIAIPEKIQNQICKYSCLLDALELLKTELNKEEGDASAGYISG